MELFELGPVEGSPTRIPTNWDYIRRNTEVNIEYVKNYYKIRAAYSLSKIFELFVNFKEFKLNFNKNKNYFEILVYLSPLTETLNRYL